MAVVVVVVDNAFIVQTPFSLVMLQDLIESLWVDVPFVGSILDSEEEVEVIRLYSVFVVPFCDDPHHFAKACDLFYKGHLASQIHHTAHRDGLEEKDLVNS